MALDSITATPCVHMTDSINRLSFDKYTPKVLLWHHFEVIATVVRFSLLLVPLLAVLVRSCLFSATPYS